MGLDMRKTNVAICAAAALGLCIMMPEGTAAFSAGADPGKVYSQVAADENGVTEVRFRGARVRGAGVRGVGFRGVGFRGAGWRGVGWRRGFRGAAFRRRGFGWGRPIGLGVGIAAADRGYGGYGGYYPAAYGGGCFGGCGCGW
jgi:hypothetical protein